MTRTTAIALVLAVLAALPLCGEDIVVSSRFTDNVLRYDATTGDFKGVFASGNGIANPNGIAVGPDGRLYIANGDVPLIHRVDAVTGQYIDRFVFDDPSTPADETGGLASPRQITFGPEGDLYVASGASDRIIRYDGKTGKLVGVVGQGGGLSGPVGVAVRSDGTVLAGGALSNGVYVYKNNTFVRKCATPSLHGTITGLLMASDGRVFAATGGRNTVLRVNVDTCQMELFASGGGLSTSIYMAYDASGNLLVGSFANNTVIRYDITTGKPLGQVMPSGAGGLNGTHSIAVVPAPQIAMTPQLVVPGAARLAGSGGSFFRTTLWLTNPSSSAATIRLRFHPGSGFVTAGAIDPDPVTIPARGSLTYADVLTDAFHVNADTGGVVIVETADGSPIPLVTARTFNDTAAGTFGQYIESIPISRQSTGDMWIHGLAADSASRTNLGIVNLGETEMRATVSLWSNVGTQLGADISVTVPPRSFVQINGVQNAVGIGNQAEFSGRVRSASTSYLAYASKLDNKTSDPIFIVPLEARTEEWIDGVGTTPGAGGTFFRSNLSIANKSEQTANVQIEYIRRGDGAPSKIANVILAPGATRFWNDAISELFSLDATAGTLWIRSDVEVTAWARTYNDRGANGTLGQFIPSFGRGDLIPATGAILQGLTDNNSFRTNAGFMNVGVAPADVIAVAYDATGNQIGLKTYHLEAGQEVFVGHVLLDIGLPASSNIDLRLNTAPANSVYAWASYVDNTSTDQTFVRPIPVP